MKGKQLAILLLVVVVLGGVWYLVAGHSSWSESGGAGGKVVSFPVNDVARVLIKSTDGEVNLVKKSDVWTVQERADYPAKFEDVSDFLRKLYDLKAVQELKVGPSQMPRLELIEPGKGAKAGTLVQLSNAEGKPITSLLLGKKYLRKSEGNNSMGMDGMDLGGGIPAGRYVKPLDGSQVSLVSDALDSANTKADHWLAKEFIAVENPKSIAVAGPTDHQHWTVVRDSATAEWKLADAKGDETLDSTKTSPFGSVLSSAMINDVLAPGAKLEDPVTTGTIETFDGFRYELKLGKEQNGNQPATVTVSANFLKERTPGKDEKPEDKKRLDDEFAVKGKTWEEKLAKEKKLEGRAYLLTKYTVETLLKNRSDFLAAKPTPAPTAAPAPAVISTPAAMPVPSVTPSPIAVPAPSAPVSVTTPPMTATVPPVEVVSPPAAVPPVPPQASATPEPTTPEATPVPTPTPTPSPVSAPVPAPTPTPEPSTPTPVAATPVPAPTSPAPEATLPAATATPTSTQ